ncbi:enoyl-CoA hydratase-related protein [Glycomyces buryatensis]|uniref:enoyl-CoA hydratase-related protein n=1 Tax=Glycomyces buryatensis TaxID=2570927 RepID=UPI0014562C7A|nr:enoyl-CoA hydratase-related protein [Glycomyces buryatensis]
MDSNDALIRYQDAHKVALITLDAPQRRNALSTSMIAQIREALARARSDERKRVVVIDHAGPWFCAGADLAESARATRLEELPAAHLAELLADICESPKPVVAVARGGARGGGVGLLAAADLVVSDYRAEFAFSEVRLGVVPAVIGPVVARKLTRGLMRRLFMTGESFSAVDGVGWGLVTKATAPDSVERHQADTVEKLLAGGPKALAGVKALTATPGLRDELRSAAAVTAEYFFSEEGREGVRSFIEKSSPPWVD